MESRMDGKIALITGGSQGLGKAMAARFVGAGAEVAIVARRPEVLEEARAEISAEAESSGKVHAYSCDVSDPKAIGELFSQVTKDLGQVDVLVNNAGTSQTGKFEEITDEVWQADFDLKLFAAIRLSRLAFPGMKERRWGRIINVLNVGAKAPSPGGAPTAVTRAAGMALTKVLAGEGAPFNVLVNALCTGLINSNQWVSRHELDPTDVPYDDWLKERGKSLPMGRYGEAVEFANMACFLASDSGSYITGTAINVDGGRSPVV